jgi:hypothetical protein
VKKNEIEAERCNCNLKCRFSFFRGCILRWELVRWKLGQENWVWRFEFNVLRQTLKLPAAQRIGWEIDQSAALLRLRNTEW